MIDEESGEFLPEEYIEHYRKTGSPPAVLMPSPLPPLAAAHYTSGGCWSLALALHERTGGLPIELYVRDGHPRHCYVVDDETALDAFGNRSLRYARAGCERTHQVADAIKLLAILRSLEPIGPKLIEEMQRPEVRDAAARTATKILDTIGWQREGSGGDRPPR